MTYIGKMTLTNLCFFSFFCRFLDPDPTLILSEANSHNPKFYNLNKAIVQLIEDFSLINFHPLDLTSEESIGDLLSHIDHSMQYGEDEEPKEPKDMDMGDFAAEADD